MTVRAREASPALRHGLELGLVGIAAVWGFTFVTVKEAVERLPLYEFLALRFALAAVAMTLLFWKQVRGLGRDGLRAGIAAGIPLLAGYAFQTWGLEHTTASNAGFVTGLFVVITPVLSAVVLRRRPGAGVWVGVVLATVGLFLLTARNGWSPRAGDLIVLGAAFSFAVHMVVLSRVSARYSAAGLAAVQMWVAAVPCAALALLTEHLVAPTSAKVVWAVLITGLAASALGYLVQTAAQRYVSPSRTAVILSCEPAFAGLFGAVVLGERLSVRGWIGAALILSGMLVAELAPRRGEGTAEASMEAPGTAR